MKVEIRERLLAEDLVKAQEFCCASPAYSYLQDPGWPELWAGEKSRHRYDHVTVTAEDGRLASYGVLRRTALGGGLALGAFRRGPVTARPEDLAPALTAMLPELRRCGIISLAVNPRWENARGDVVETILGSLGARVAPAKRQRLHSRTGLIDLTGPADQLLAACDSHTRRQLRKIERLGLSVRPMQTDRELALFDDWFDAFCRDRGLDRGGLPSLAAQRHWVENRGGDCAVVEWDGKPVGAFTLLRDGPRLLNLAVAWADPNARLPRSYIVYWHAIRKYAGRQGDAAPRWLDTAGRIDPRVHRPDAGAEGRERFKTGFPQIEVTLPRVHQFALRPLLFNAFDRLENWLR